MRRRRPRPPAAFRRPSGAIGALILLAVVALALLGPVLAPHDIATAVGGPGEPPSADFLLGTDGLGRDVLSRLLDGGFSVLWIGTVATALAYAAGLGVGLIAGYSRTVLDGLLMRGVDVLLSFPALLVLLLLVAGLGQQVSVLILGVVLVQLPGIARVMRTATLEASTRGYVEAAVVRGERTSWVLTREIFPNIAPVVLADFGVRFGYSIILIASMNYLGLGLLAPTADWGLMISENRDFISLNPTAVLAPAIMLGLLTVGVNLVADATVRAAPGAASGARRPATVASPSAAPTGDVGLPTA